MSERPLENECAESSPTDPALPTAVDPYLGLVVDGRYVIEHLLGQGGMGVVYGCTHVALEKRFAMKILRSYLVSDAEISSRFLNEARAASAIGNPHIVHISDFGRLPDGAAYFVMEYLRGVPLSQLMSGTLAPERLLPIARQLAEGLAAAHAAGVVHRDLKPDNIFLVNDGGSRDFVKILDFGIAKIMGGKRMTQAGMVFGTPYYMSPEQAAGAAVDGRADVYSLGIILYELASGRVPFDGESCMSVIADQMYAPLPLLGSEVPAPLAAVVHRCLRKDPAHRYQSMSELMLDLDRVRAGDEPHAMSDDATAELDRLTPYDIFATAESVAPAPLAPAALPFARIAVALLVLATTITAVYWLTPNAGEPAVHASATALAQGVSAPVVSAPAPSASAAAPRPRATQPHGARPTNAPSAVRAVRGRAPERNDPWL